MNVVIIGSGGREHALAYRISQSSKLSNLFIIPGNPGTESLGQNIQISANDKKKILDFCIENKIELVVIGPEQPLVDGLSDYLRDNGISVFGPSQKAAQIEGDKAFAKKLMKKYHIPSAEFDIYDLNSRNKAATYLKQCTYPIVIKASGLAAGKGVVICQNIQDAEHALEDCFEKKVFGDAGEKIVIEEFLSGEEASIFAVTDGNDYVILPASQDHKQILDGDKGKNTGGMGAYAPAPVVTDEILEKVEEEIIQKTLAAMRDEGIPYSGCLYCGLMITAEGPKVIEFNCRFGDPETQAVLPLVEGDFLQLLYSSAKGHIDRNTVSYKDKSAVCVVAVSSGYPGSYEKGKEITGLNDIADDHIIVFHAGTAKRDDKIFTNGGRVLGVTAVSDKNDLKSCKNAAYKALSKIHFDGIYFRKDISDKALKQK